MYHFTHYFQEKAEKAQLKTQENLKLVQRENENLKLELLEKEEELKKLQEQMNKARNMAFAAVAMADTLAKDIKVSLLFFF